MENGAAFNQGKLKDEQLEELKNLFRHALKDSRLSTKELTQIQFFYYDSELSEKDFAALKESVFREVVHAAAEDHRITTEEQAAILRLARQLNTSPETMEWARGEFDRYS